MRLGSRATLAEFSALDALDVPKAVRDRLLADRAIVDAAAEGDAPVYGLNTGLGANLGHRIAPGDIARFQRQLLEGRAVAVGPPLPEPTGRAVLLARLVSIRGSGISLEMFDHLLAVYASGLSPVVPAFGSIGAGDLTQNAVWALALLGTGRMWRAGEMVGAGEALASVGLVVPDLRPKDAMALINHGGLSSALSAQALQASAEALAMGRAAALLSYAGYDANRDIFAPEVNALRPAPGQGETAAWFAERLTGAQTPRRVQEALSFRTVAPVLGAALDAQTRATAIWSDEVNGLSDSPAVLGRDAMRSTPNFHGPALALALESVALANAMTANGALHRCQRMMNPDLSGLPRYLSPEGGASAGMVPAQKTAAALLSEIRRHAMPVTLDPAPVSDAVEDMAPMTPQAARKLSEQAEPLRLLAGYEALVACQAIDLRGQEPPPAVAALHRAVRAQIPPLGPDRPLGGAIETAAQVLAETAEPL